jgi:hypothetical protein
LPALQREYWGSGEPRVNWSRIQAAYEFLEGKVLTDVVAAPAATATKNKQRRPWIEDAGWLFDTLQRKVS